MAYEESTTGKGIFEQILQPYQQLSCKNPSAIRYSHGAYCIGTCTQRFMWSGPSACYILK